MEKSELILEKLTELASTLSGQAILHKQVLSLEEAHKYIGISKSYLYKLTCKNKITCYRPSGKLIFFKKDDLDAWQLQNRQSTVAELQEAADQFSLKGSSNKSIL